MIDLSFLPFRKIAKKHHDELHDDVLDKFKKIKAYYFGLSAFQAQPLYPEALIDTALLVFPQKKGARMKPLKTAFPNVDLYKDCITILVYLEKKISLTLKGSPKQCDQMVTDLLPVLSKYYIPGKKFSYREDFKHFIEGLSFVWSYGGFIAKADKPDVWDAYQLATALNVNICPYCNRLYTNTINNEVLIKRKIVTEKLIRPEFDHFYLKSRYPFLALSFYNLVPSCSICNSTLKGEENMTIHTHCHPYLEGYEDVCVFETGIDLKAYLSKRKPHIPIAITTNKKANSDHITRAEATHGVFKLAQIYPSHADIAAEMFQKSTDDSRKLIENYWNQISIKGNYLFDTKEELYRHFIGNFLQKKEFYKRPLSKFQYDILAETKLIEYIKNLPARPLPKRSIPLKKV